MARPLRAAKPAAVTADALEGRRMMAGHMNVWLAGGVLTVNADGRANTIDVAVAANGDVTVSSPDTLANGSAEPRTFSGEEIRHINIRAGHGYDTVTVRGPGGGEVAGGEDGLNGEGTAKGTVAGSLRVLAQHGIDGVRVENLSVGGGLRVEGGVDNDRISIEDVDAAAVTVTGASGVDAIALKDVASESRLLLYAGTGSDRVAVSNVSAAADRVRLFGGEGHDWIAADDFNEVIAAGQNGNDTVVREVSNALNAVVAAGVIEEVNRRLGREAVAFPIDLTAWPDGSEVPPPTLLGDSDHRFFQATASGATARIIGESDGAAKPTDASTVTVHYEGRLLDGRVFDSSYERGTPAEFPLRNLITGWRRLIPLLEPGQRMQMFLPASEAYGNRGSGIIEPGATIMFSVELIAFEG